MTLMTGVARGGVGVLTETVLVAGGGVVDCETSCGDPTFKFGRKTGAVLANLGKLVMETPRGLSIDRRGPVVVSARLSEFRSDERRSAYNKQPCVSEGF